MTTRIAVISDIHANLEALNSVIEDIKNQNINKIICLGDIIGKGIHAHECISLIKENCDMVVMGNVDDRFCANLEDFKHDLTDYSRIKFNQSLMTEDDINYLKALPYSIEFYLSGNLVRMYHSNPNNFHKTVSNFDTNLSNKFNMFKGGKYTVSDKVADIVVFGHLHYQVLEKFYNRTLINCGSVGNSGCLISDERYDSDPFEIIKAHYLILEGKLDSVDKSDNLSITFRSVDYSIEKELNSGKYNPEYKDYERELKNGKYRYIQNELNKLKNFGYKFDDKE